MGKTFNKFRSEVLQIAKKEGISLYVPHNTFLFELWKQKLGARSVVNGYCNKEAQRDRIGQKY